MLYKILDVILFKILKVRLSMIVVNFSLTLKKYINI